MTTEKVNDLELVKLSDYFRRRNSVLFRALQSRNVEESVKCRQYSIFIRILQSV